MRKTLEQLYPIFTSAAIGDFNIEIEVPEEENELTPLWVGLKIMFETVNEKLHEVEETKRALEKSNKQLISSNAVLNRSLTENHRLMKTLQDLVAVIMHDLKGPVGNLKTLITLREEAENHEEAMMFDSVMKDCVNIMDRTLADLNEVIAVRHASEIASEVKVSRVWNTVLKMMAAEVKQNEVKVKTNFKDGDEFVYPQTELQSILSNFLSNSIKYRRLDKRLVIEVNTSRQRDHVKLSFSDNGQGIDLSRYEKKLFRLFQRFHEGTEGKGMGLYLIKSQVESHGGRVEVESKPGKGTTFHVYLKDLKRLPRD